MISQITGLVQMIDQGQIEVSLKIIGLSFTLSVPSVNKYILNSEVSFFTYMHWNQEQGPTMFGFEDQAQRRMFLAMISCSGIGPKMALTVLEQLGLGAFVCAIQQQDVKLLSTVNGIGNKKAEQMIVQLKHRIDKLIEHQDFVNLCGNEHIAEVRGVLVSLNYSLAEIARAIDYIKQTNKQEGVSFDMALRQALSFLSKNV